MTQRTIKFRAWDEERKFMDYFDLWHIGTGDDIVHCPLMQFTGLLDKNGKEIFEGDILQYPNETMKPVIRYGEYSLGSYETYEEGVGFYLELDGTQYRSLTTEHGKRLKIIGNIYENKDLLK